MKVLKHPKRHIHRHLRKKAPHAVKKAKKLFALRYPKLTLLIAVIILAYYLFKNLAAYPWMSNLGKFSYLGVFIAGVLSTFGFTAPFAVGFFIVSNPQNLFFAAIIGAVGALLSDILIFNIIKLSFAKEFEMLKREKIVEKIRAIANENISVKIRHYGLYIFAGILIATPLPDEVGISMLAGLTTIKLNVLATISFILHFIMILLLMAIGIIWFS
ncbi:hypothetical protein J4225_00750 [Candidatus Pacearchaeota archaeon]|nr:hypothetical protein [Candidatus Pacearchaeota archaeon]